MKTQLHTYRFNISNKLMRFEYERLAIRLNATPGRGRWMHSSGGESHSAHEARTVDLETGFIFANQWNTADGFRVFDWAEDACLPNKHIKQGHYLDITSEMVAARTDQHVCGYCGFRCDRESARVSGFMCAACLDSPYLKESELHLLRLMPVSVDDARRAPLDPDHYAEVLARYVVHQATGKDSRAVQRRAMLYVDVKRRAEVDIANAITERDGFLWLLDHHVNIDNCIFYEHTGRFGFGWTSPVSVVVHGALVDALVEFPFDYDIKQA